MCLPHIPNETRHVIPYPFPYDMVVTVAQYRYATPSYSTWPSSFFSHIESDGGHWIKRALYLHWYQATVMVVTAFQGDGSFIDCIHYEHNDYIQMSWNAASENYPIPEVSKLTKFWTYWGRDKMDSILQMIFWDVLSRMKISCFDLNSIEVPKGSISIYRH